MKETMEQSQMNTINTQPTVLFQARLEQLGYECVSVSCDQFTMLTLMPKEINRIDEMAPPSE